MDRKLHQQEIERLIQLGASARAGLSRSAVVIQRRLDVPSRVRSSLQNKPFQWAIGSLAAGLVVSLLFRRPAPKPQSLPATKKRGLALTLLGLTLTAVRPFAKAWLTDQLKHYLASQVSKGNRIQIPPQLL